MTRVVACIAGGAAVGFAWGLLAPATTSQAMVLAPVGALAGALAGAAVGALA
jgi:hypothetical protein